MRKQRLRRPTLVRPTLEPCESKVLLSSLIGSTPIGELRLPGAGTPRQ